MRFRLLVLFICVSLNILPFLITFSSSANIQPDSQSQERLLTIDELPSKSKRYALVIGVDKYDDQKISTLKGAVNDAKSLAKALVDYAGFPRDQVVLLTNDQAADLQPLRNNILEKLSNLAATAKRDNGLLLISFAGHGIERNGQPYLLSVDARLGNENDLELLEDTAVNVNKIKNRLKGLDQVILILDACRNDPAAGRGESENKMTESFARNFGLDTRNKDVKAFATLFATSPGQVSYEYREKAQGYFTYTLIEALKGNAENIANEKGEITLGRLVSYLQERVPKLVSLNLGKQQKPQLVVEGYKPDQLVISVTINMGSSTVNNSVTTPITTPGVSAAELEFWNTIKASNNPAEYRAYLKKYPNGEFAELATVKLTALENNTKNSIDKATGNNPSSPANSTAASGEPLSPMVGKFVHIPAGEYMMGTEQRIDIDFGYFNDNERPAHKVKITKEFEIGMFEITQAQWEAVMGSNPSSFKGADLPVENVSWNDVQEYINRLNSKSKRYIYRLPTEAEWEYTCRAGSNGDFADNLDSIGWYGNNSGDQIIDALEIRRKDNSNYARRLGNNRCRTHPIGQKLPNAWGIFDMHGNVREWCQDFYNDNYYKQSPGSDPQGPSAGTGRARRGGGWFNYASYCRSAFRYGSPPETRSNDLGFRLVRNLR